MTLPPPGDVHLWIMDPADATDPALCRDYRERCLPASERDALESEAANMTEGALRQATHSKALMRWVLARYCARGVAPADLRFAHGEHGKPRLVGVGGGGDFVIVESLGILGRFMRRRRRLDADPVQRLAHQPPGGPRRHVRSGNRTLASAVETLRLTDSVGVPGLGRERPRKRVARSRRGLRG